MLKPYLLRRRKDDSAVALQLPEKTEHVLFCRLSDCQRSIYKDLLRSPEIEAVLEKRLTAFRAITTLRKLCNHPALVFQNGKFIWDIEEGLEHIKESLKSDKDVAPVVEQAIPNGRDTVPIAPTFSWENSGKLLVLSKILPLWFAEKHKVLIFSQVLQVTTRRYFWIFLLFL